MNTPSKVSDSRTPDSPGVGSATGSAWSCDGNLVEVAQHMQQCGHAWEPGARLIGNCRACDIATIAGRFLILENLIWRAARELSDTNLRREEEGQQRSAAIDQVLDEIEQLR